MLQLHTNRAIATSRQKPQPKMAAVKKERNDYTPTLLLLIAESGTVLVVENTL
jgi:hypothetical protein